MKYIDVFNGDADGLCALHQLRLIEPRDAHLITGVKRDIKLLQQVTNRRHAIITVLDISLDSNRESLLSLLANHCQIFYVDHHFAGDIPPNQKLETHIDPNPETCTALIVDRLIQGRHRLWALVGAFGDNLQRQAYQTAKTLCLRDSETSQLKELGELLNYNAYGASTDDLHFHPRVVHKAMQPFKEPFEFYRKSHIVEKLRNGFNRDMAKALTFSPFLETATVRFYRFPQESWSKRIAGLFINAKVHEKPSKAHALVVANVDGTERISVRAPLNNPSGADALCRKFPTGGGRAGAAGVNALPSERFNLFRQTFENAYTS